LVRISKDFYLGKYPVTQEQYQAITGINPSWFCASGKRAEKVAGQDTRQFPVEMVSWDDAMAFCEKLSQRTGKNVVLPTEAEWEYACRGGTTTAYYFGNALNGAQANCDGNYPFGTTTKGPYLERTSRVGSYECEYPHPWGLCDVHGNVWEWCRDWYDTHYYKKSTNIDPFCVNSEQNRRVLRGGSWDYYAWSCRAARRYRSAAALCSCLVGFRVAIDLI
jgi:formylglycine-generating enzyme required for sulfatase activity